MAEGFANHYGKGWLTAYSAGSKPAGIIMPNTIEVMREKGIDITAPEVQRSFRNQSAIDALDCHSGRDSSEFIPDGFLRVRVLHWFVPDPVGEPIDAYRKVRDEIETRVLKFIDAVQPET